MYAYCSNNPVIYLDPSGEVIITAAVIAGAAIGGAIIMKEMLCPKRREMSGSRSSGSFFA